MGRQDCNPKQAMDQSRKDSVTDVYPETKISFGDEHLIVEPDGFPVAVLISYQE
jgi:hypothetical protein